MSVQCLRHHAAPLPAERDPVKCDVASSVIQQILLIPTVPDLRKCALARLLHRTEILHIFQFHDDADVWIFCLHDDIREAITGFPIRLHEPVRITGEYPHQQIVVL